MALGAWHVMFGVLAMEQYKGDHAHAEGEYRLKLGKLQKMARDKTAFEMQILERLARQAR